MVKLFRLSPAGLTFLSFLLLDDPANELLLSVGLGTDYILTKRRFPLIGVLNLNPTIILPIQAAGFSFCSIL
jgi:hypothetical protein